MLHLFLGRTSRTSLRHGTWEDSMYALVLPAQPCSPDPSSASGDVALDAYGSTSLLSASARRVGPVDLQHRAFPVRQSCELGHSGELASRESDAGAGKVVLDGPVAVCPQPGWSDRIPFWRNSRAGAA